MKNATNRPRIVATTRYRDHNGQATESEVPDLTFISGMAPECKLLSLKVLDGAGDDHVGSVKGAIQALQHIQRLNGYGRRLLVHGVNLSVGASSSRSGSRAVRARCAWKWIAWSGPASWSSSRPATRGTAWSPRRTVRRRQDCR